MARFKVVEKFVSINGEGRRAGQLAVFVRFKGCNLNCGYCDTKWANESGAEFEYMSEDDIYGYIKKTRVKNVTLTGGEPLIQEGICDLLEYLSDDGELRIEIETNGSVNLERFCLLENRPSFTMDYKLGLSGMEDKMDLSNFRLLGSGDTVKFVVGSRDDLEKAKRIVEEYLLTERCAVYLSPVFGAIEPKEIVDFMIENNLNDINLQLQLHKFIWAPDQKGV
ncbi:MAG TPA: putative 7-carboxy-7-deazaguanine synthase QueE [Firmicutes bacterium]|nr:putative 7-carboxy-7-deazaguanine synthase QueE [Bacillota bacterium]